MLIFAKPGIDDGCELYKWEAESVQSYIMHA